MGIGAEDVLAGVGGAKNVLDIEECITRLRIEVRELSLVDEASLRAAGAFGVVIQADVVQVVIGPDADEVNRRIEALRAAAGEA